MHLNFKTNFNIPIRIIDSEKATKSELYKS